MSKRQLISWTTRTILGLLGVGGASLFAVTYWFDISREELVLFLTGTLVFIVTVMLLAGLLVIVTKLPAIWRRNAGPPRRDKTDDKKAHRGPPNDDA